MGYILDYQVFILANQFDAWDIKQNTLIIK